MDRCHGPTVDVGCGPGRLVQALTVRGVPALGVDTSPRAVSQCRARGVPVILGDAFAPVPYKGRWQHVLLADGNIGVGGSPPALLRLRPRCCGRPGPCCWRPRGYGAGLWHGSARLHGPSFAELVRWPS